MLSAMVSACYAFLHLSRPYAWNLTSICMHIRATVRFKRFAILLLMVGREPASCDYAIGTMSAAAYKDIILMKMFPRLLIRSQKEVQMKGK